MRPDDKEQISHTLLTTWNFGCKSEVLAEKRFWPKSLPLPSPVTPVFLFISSCFCCEESAPHGEWRVVLWWRTSTKRSLVHCFGKLLYTRRKDVLFLAELLQRGHLTLSKRPALLERKGKNSTKRKERSRPQICGCRDPGHRSFLYGTSDMWKEKNIRNFSWLSVWLISWRLTVKPGSLNYHLDHVREHQC